ncbi:hypothetical protein [Synechococcus phage S-EIVl]|nr:hypothetical protein [Synechococcus phage S-EIVl]
MTKGAWEPTVVAPSLQGLWLRGAQVPKVDLVLFGFVATQDVCHVKKVDM